MGFTIAWKPAKWRVEGIFNIYYVNFPVDTRSTKNVFLPFYFIAKIRTIPAFI